MNEEPHNETEEALNAYDYTPTQRNELRQNPELLIAWTEWARNKPLRNPAGAILARYREGQPPPEEPDLAEPPTQPDHTKLLATATRLVQNTGHEYREEELLEEITRLAKATKVGNGATLTETEERQLLNQAARMRAETDQNQAEQQQKARAFMVTRTADQLVRGTVSTHHYRNKEMENRLTELFGDDFPGDVAEEAEHMRQRLEDQHAKVLERLTNLEDPGQGPCYDCKRHVTHRRRHGRLDLCRACLIPRLRVQDQHAHQPDT